MISSFIETVGSTIVVANDRTFAKLIFLWTTSYASTTYTVNNLVKLFPDIRPKLVGSFVSFGIIIASIFLSYSEPIHG